jgi:iron(III) transport system ATP-binding protein
MITVQRLKKGFEGSQRKSKTRSTDPTTYGARVLAVADVSFEVQPGEMFTLLGPSGCGKTTTLRLIAGLERPDEGVVTVGERVLFDSASRMNVPANKRGIGMVFQSYAIWPHMSVFRNVAFPLEVASRRQRPGRSEIRKRVELALSATQLLDFADRPATKLSGGQQQRLALARALVAEPTLILLDEPLSNLDAQLRESMRFELKRVQRELGITSIYVTHDQTEALALSSRIAVMNAGEVVQLGKPREIYSKPANRFVAQFVGVTNLVPGVLRKVGAGHRVSTSCGDVAVGAQAALPDGAEVLASIRPEAIEVNLHSRSGEAAWEWRGKVVNRAFLGDTADHVIAVNDVEVRVRSNPSVSIAPGTEVYLTAPAEQIAVVAQ